VSDDDIKTGPDIKTPNASREKSKGYIPRDLPVDYGDMGERCRVGKRFRDIFYPAKPPLVNRILLNAVSLSYLSDNDMNTGIK